MKRIKKNSILIVFAVLMSGLMSLSNWLYDPYRGMSSNLKQLTVALEKETKILAVTESNITQLKQKIKNLQ